MQVGDVVVVFGKQDSRVRHKDNSALVKGTIEQILSDDHVSVLLENGDIWVGNIRDCRPAKEQE